MKQLHLKAKTENDNPITFKISPATDLREVDEHNNPITPVYDVQVDMVEIRPKRMERDCAVTTVKTTLYWSFTEQEMANFVVRIKGFSPEFDIDKVKQVITSEGYKEVEIDN